MKLLFKKILYRFPLTRIRMAIATVLYYMIIWYRKTPFVTVCRNGIWYRLDLREGIDLSIFILGYFQKHLFTHSHFTMPGNPIIIDIGANIGSVSLPLAKQYPNGQIYAIEPSDIAFKKLTLNRSLNPLLKERIILSQHYLSDSTGKIPAPVSPCFSWRIDSKKHGSHPIHGGYGTRISLKESITLDDFLAMVSQQKNQPVKPDLTKSDLIKPDLIKIDTDGYELKILNGCRETIEKYRPVIIFETGKYIMKEYDISFQDYLTFFSQYNYRLISLQDKIELTSLNCKRMIPDLSTIDILAIPAKTNH